VIPPLTLELDLGNPLTTATWTANITSYLRSWSSRRGASTELQKTEAGEAGVTLDNRDGRFTPGSANSPYYPNLLPMRRMRMRTTVDGTVYPVWTMFIEDIPVSFPGSGFDNIVNVHLVDGFAVLSLAPISGSFSQQLSSARVTAVLDAIGWPAGDRTISTGIQTIPAQTLAVTSALEHLQAVERAEGGKLFMGRDGKVTFQNRYEAVTGTPPGIDRTWSDSGAGMSYRDLVPRFGTAYLYNEAHVTRVGGTEQSSINTASQTKYGPRAFPPVTDLLVTNDPQAHDYAEWFAQHYAEPIQRIEQLQDDAMQHGQWSNVVGREMNDRVMVMNTAIGGQDSLVQGIAHEWIPDQWWVTFNVSPSQAAALFTWDVSRWDVDTAWAR